MTGKEARYWDTITTEWQKKQRQTLWRTHSDAVNVALLARWLPTGRFNRVLKTDLFDESVSAGLYSLLASRAKIVVGMDVSALTLRVAKSRCTSLQATGADARCLPFVDGAFDVIVSNSTLDHFESPDEIVISLRELHRVLRPGGQLLLTLDNLANPVIALRSILPFRLLNRLGIVPYYVGATFGPRRLQSVLQQLNFKVIEVNGLMHCPRVFAVAMARILEKYTTVGIQKGFLRFLLAFERLSELPTRFFTGYFIAVRAIKR